MKTLSGEEIVKLPDGAGLGPEDGWFKPTVNPFVHGCCDCGLAHQVEIGFLCGDEIVRIVAEESNLIMRFTRDERETENIRNQKKS